MHISQNWQNCMLPRKSEQKADLLQKGPAMRGPFLQQNCLANSIEFIYITQKLSTLKRKA